MRTIDPGKFGGPHTAIKSDADRRQFLSDKARIERQILERIIADDDDEKAVEIARKELVALEEEGC